MSRHSTAKWPVSNISTVSPGDSVFDERRFPRAGAGRGIDHDRRRGLEHALEAVEHLAAEPRERRAAVIDGRLRHRAQHAVGHVGRPGDLEKVTASHNATFDHE